MEGCSKTEIIKFQKVGCLHAQFGSGAAFGPGDFKSAMSTYSIIAAKGFLPKYPLRNGLEGEIKLSYSSTVSRERQVL